MVAYQTAYLKANYPLEYMAALLTSLMDKIEKICSSSHLIEDFCKLKGGGEGLELLEFAFVKHLLDAHGGDFIIKKKGDDHILTITLPKEKGE